MMLNNAIAPYQPFAWQLEPLRDKSPVVVMTGSAGGGKSRCAAEKVHAYCLKYPGAMGLMLRKMRESMTNSTALFVERKIIGKDPRVKHVPSKYRFEYENGSILAYGGMKDEQQREQIRSIGQDGALDIVWMEEATRFTEDDFNEILGRMRGKAADWRQIILTTNPGSPSHWIKTRLIDKREGNPYFSSALDNPANPPDYLVSLSKMTGVLKLRLVEGKWVQAEGVVYDNWDEGNITTEAEYNPQWEVRWGVDDGYVFGKGPGTESYHPRVFLLANITPQGFFHIFDEYYATGELSETSIANVLAMPNREHPYKLPEIAFVDSSAAELKARLHLTNIMAAGATHPVGEGIKNMRRFVCDADGVRMLKVHPRCENFIREMSSYQFDENSKVSSVGERKAAKIDDHGPDAARYLLWSSRFNE